MGAAASLDPQALVVDPGGMATCTVTVRNTGSVVDELSFSVLGPAGEWADVSPPSVSLFPGAEGTATVRFRPPRSATTRSGRIPFGLRVASREDPAGSVVEEGAITVSSYGATTAELTPRTQRGRRGARYELAVDNRGNAERIVRLTPADPSEALRFRLDPPELTVAPGTAAFVKVRASSGRSFLRGQPKTHPFTIAVEPEGDSAIAVDGAFLQEALLPKWLLPALLAIVALALIWFFLLKPEIKTQARDAVKQPIAKANQKAAAAQQAANTAAQKADTAAAAAGQKQAAGGGGGGGGGGKKPPKVTKPATTTASATVSQGTPTYGRIGSGCSATCGGQAKAGKKQTLAFTDLILQNPAGDSGLLTISFRGKPEMIFRLDNFRDYDYHFIASPTLGPSQAMTVSVQCQNKGGKTCTAAVFWTGFAKQVKA
jgi:hypothetical protein